MDMSDSKRAEAEARARLAAIIESSDDAIVSKTLNGIVKTWNNGASAHPKFKSKISDFLRLVGETRCEEYP